MTKENLKQKTLSAISLGCDKNRTDLEHMLFAVADYGINVTADIEKAEIVIINTCAFIESAIQEAIEHIMYAIELKKQGKIEKIIVSGCLPMREKQGVIEQFPEVDAFITLEDNPKIVSIIENLYGLEDSGYKFNPSSRIVTHQGGYAYLKIAEGCSNGCAYCTIPRIRGRFRSLPEKQILTEASLLVKKGYKELILVAQDTARYGEDITGKPNLVALLENLVKIKGLKWIKLQYIYPEWVTIDLLEFIAHNPKMCKYLDIPLQHIDNQILHAMNRKTDEDHTRKLIKFIKTNYPEIILRSTFIVGFPTEKNKHFQKLCDFILEENFPYASFFAYSREEKTKAYYMKGQVPKFIKKRRLKKIIELQNIVINNFVESQIGKTFEVMIDEFNSEEHIFLGHDKNSAPDVDLKVVFPLDENPSLRIGEIYTAKITQKNEFGFKGELI